MKATMKKPLGASKVVLFEGKTLIGRTYRVVFDGVDVLHFYREFDHQPGKWHLEGSVRGTADGYQAALSRHTIGGDGLEYVK